MVFSTIYTFEPLIVLYDKLYNELWSFINSFKPSILNFSLILENTLLELDWSTSLLIPCYTNLLTLTQTELSMCCKPSIK